MKEHILYKDLQGVRITSKKFYADDKSYALHKITKINLRRASPKKNTAFILFGLGIASILIGSFDLLPTIDLTFKSVIWIINLQFLAMIFGVVVFVFAIFRMLFVPDEYAVNVETKDGKKTSVKSDNRKYAARLAASLKRAYYRQESSKANDDLIIS